MRNIGRLMATISIWLGLMAMAASAQNLVSNPGFESGTTSWNLRDYASSLVSSPTHNGSKALKLINDFTGDSGDPMHQTIQYGVSPTPAGKEYIFSVWVRGDDVRGIGGGGKPIAALNWRKSTGGGTGRRGLYMWAPYGTYTWRQMKIYCEAPPTAAKCDVDARSWWDCTNGITYWDDWSVVERDFSDRGSLLGTYQAESADVISSCDIRSAEPDYTGSGYVYPESSTAYVQWNSVNEGAGERIFVVRYSMEAGSPTFELLVNGASKGTKTMVATGSPEGWGTESWTANLNTGDNTVRLKLRQGVVGPWIDKLDVYAPASSGPTPDPPTNLVATAVSTTQINVVWDDMSTDEDGFKLDRRETGTTTWDRIETTGANDTSHNDPGLPASTKFYYKVKAYNENGNSSYSNIDDATTQAAVPVPAAPTNLTATAVSSSQIDLDWDDMSTNESGFRIDRRQTGSTTWTVPFASVGANVSAYNDTGLPAETRFYYKVKAYNAGGNSSESNQADATTLAVVPVPDPPTNLTATAVSSSQIDLDWDDMSTNESGFRIDRRQTGSTTWTVPFASVGANVSAHNDSGLPAETKFYYRVRAYNATGESANTAVADATTTAGAVEKIAKGAAWRYRKGTEEASAPAARWRERLYDDSGWSNGPAPFGYASGWSGGTELDDMQDNYMCVFLRRGFDVADPALVEQIDLDVDYDDGFIAWINGREVARVNMPGAGGTFLPFDANSSGYVSANSTNWTTALTGGEIPELDTNNVLTVQAFNIASGSGDLMLDASLSVTLDALAPGDDADGDVLPDGWENDKLGNTNQNAAADGDNDRVPNLGEYIGGTDPDNSNEFFAVSLAISNDNAYVSFDTVIASGEGYTDLTRYYALERKVMDGLSGWFPVPDYGRVQATGQPVNYTNAVGAHPLLFRGRVWLE